MMSDLKTAPGAAIAISSPPEKFAAIPWPCSGS